VIGVVDAFAACAQRVRAVRPGGGLDAVMTR
jgi:hypothetical protein